MSAGLRVPTLPSMREALAVGLLTLCLAGARPAWSQEVTATITGSVVDPTGASIVGAALIAKDTERGTVYTVRSNGVGVFNLPRVPVGTYELKAGAPGFQSAVYRSLTLVLNQTARVDFQLNLGLATETIDVISAAPLLHTDSTQLSTVIDAALRLCSGENKVTMKQGALISNGGSSSTRQDSLIVPDSSNHKTLRLESFPIREFPHPV